MLPQELVKPIALAAAPCAVALLIAYLLGGSGAAFVVGLLMLPVAWFALGFPGLAAAVSVVMLTLATLLLVGTFVEPKGSDVELLRDADADVRQARRVATAGFEGREASLKDTISRQRKELIVMSRRVDRLERALRTAVREARRTATPRGRRGRGSGSGAPRRR